MNRIFISPENEVIRAASIEDAAMFVERGWRELSSEEIQAAGMSGFEQYVSPVTATVLEDGRITFTPPTDDEISKNLFTALRAARDARLADTDKMLLPDYPISADALAQVKTYRAALRDLPDQPGAPWDGGGEATTWPELPKT